MVEEGGLVVDGSAEVAAIRGSVGGLQIRAQSTHQKILQEPAHDGVRATHRVGGGFDSIPSRGGGGAIDGEGQTESLVRSRRSGTNNNDGAGVKGRS